MPDGNCCLTLLPRAEGRRALFGWRAISQVVVSFLLAFTAVDAAPPTASPSVRSVRLPIIEGKDIRFTHLSTEEGLSQSRVDHILQDAQGFMWFGTYNGLNRYDGYRFKVYKPEANNPNSIGGVFITVLFQDRSGALWIGVDQGLDRFDPATETFTHFLSNPGDPASLAGHVEHMTQDRDGILWLATRNGLDRLDPATARFTHYRNNPHDPSSLSSSDVRFVYEDRQGTLWVATAAGPDAFDRRTGKVIRHYPDPQQPPLDRILEDRSGTLWMCATRRGGLMSLDRGTGVFTRYVWFEGWSETPGMRGCSAIHEDKYGTVWLATRPDGLVRFDRSLRKFTRYRNDPGNPASMSNNAALSLVEDREGGIWVGTDGGGVNRFPSKPSPFTIIRKEPGNPNSLDQSFALSVFEDSQGILWLGTDQLNRLDRKTGKYTFFRPRTDVSGSITDGTVYAITEDHAGVLWFGTWGGGLNRFDRRTGRFKAYRHKAEDPGSLSNDRVLALFVDRTGTLWAGTEDGLNRFDPRTEHFTVYRDTGPPSSRIYRVITEGADGSIWFGTYEWGLQRLDQRTGKIVTYRHDPTVKGTLSNNRVNALCVDRSGQLWVGTQDGLDRYDRQTGKFAILNERDGLPNNAIQGILEDAAGNLWLSTGNGLSKFDPRTRTFKNYYADDGLAGDEFNNFSVYHKSARGEMFFGGVDGVTAFFPERVTDNPYVPPVVLTEFRLFGEPLPIGGNSPLRKSVLLTESLSLSHRQNIFSLEFSSLSYASPLRNRYRYKLVSLDKDWNEADSSHRFATYTTLPPGEYLFRVQGSNNRGVWNEKGVTLRIQILPPWWSTWWFRGVCAVVFLLLLWAAYQFRVHQLQRESKQLRDVIDTIPGHVWSALPDGSLDFINQRWLEFSGLSLEEGLGWGWEAAVHPEDRARFDEAWRAAVACGNPMETEARIRRADGQYRWLLIRNVPLLDEGEKIVKWYGTSTDIDDRKRAEQKIQEQETELRQVLDLTPLLVGVFGPDRKRVYANRSTLDYFGLSLEEWQATSDPLFFFHPDDRERVANVVYSGMASDVPHEFEARMRRYDGQYRWFLFRDNPLRDEQGCIKRWYLSATDIEDRKQAEDRLRSTADELQRVMASISDCLWSGELDEYGKWNYRYYSPAVEKITGRPASFYLQEPISYFGTVHADDRPRVAKAFERLVTGQSQREEGEYRIMRADGEMRWVRDSAVATRSGQRLRIDGVVSDITERKRAEEELRASESRFRALVEHAADAILVRNDEGKLVDVNQQACDSMGYTRDELIRMTPRDFVDPAEDPALFRWVNEQVLAGAIFAFESRHRRKDGTVFPVEVRVRPFWHSGQRLTLALVRDITERKRAEEEREKLRQLEADLAQINRVSMLGELAASIAHEVNQPLSGIVSSGGACLRWLAADPPNLEEARQSVRRIVGAGKHAAEVITRIRALTKRAAVTTEKLDLNETIRDVLALVGDEAKRTSVRLRTRFAGDLSPVSGDRVQLQQVVLNLVMNGIEAMSSLGERTRELVITTRNIDADQVQVTVQDRGIGFDPSTKDKIFDSFYTTKPGGMGMGLSISRSILQAHGGRLWATATEGGGATLHFTVPKYHEEESDAAV